MTELSTHKAEVVEVKLEPHPNADSLSIVRVHGGYPCVVRTEDWQDGQLGAYIPPDSVVDVTRPEFAFLGGGTKTKHHVRARKIRGVVSFGLLMPVPPGVSCVGGNVADYYGVEHYEQELASACTGGEAEHPPGILSRLPKYDIDSLRRYPNVLEDREPVLITEKIHGANSRFAWAEGRMWCGSRSEWKRYDPNNTWWKALKATPTLEEFCQKHEGVIVYGEVYGSVQALRYGCKRGEVKFAGFDILRRDRTWTPAMACRTIFCMNEIPQVPMLASINYAFERVCSYADGPSMLAANMREGCVVKPLHERWHDKIGRVQLKVVSGEYLEATT